MTMTNTGAHIDYPQFFSFAQAFQASQPTEDVDGDYYELAGTTVFRRSIKKLDEGGRLEVNLITPDAPEEFEWNAEITINNKADDEFIHLILRRDHSVVETYGKTILPVDAERSTHILHLLHTL